ncbi:MAG: PQQ-binding-like beta-propeller repeat protein [Planctomycetes bacterium]|nr:PQQ-binding-like beta-propeller repeat protein [Planctomycetota bacterium]
MRIYLVASLILGLSLSQRVVTQRASADDWPQFRGPGGQGLAPASRLPVHWSKTENVRWAADVPGVGWSSPVVRGNRIWLTTAVETKPTPEQIEAQRKASRLEADLFKRRQVAGSVSVRVLSFDLETGKRLRNTEFVSVQSPEAIHVGNTYASPTPVIEGDRLYVHFGINGTACLDAETHKVIWQRTIPVFYSVGVGSSPVIYGELLILVCDGIDTQFITALDKQTGKTAWKVSRPPFRTEEGQRQKAYSTPLVIRHDGRDQLVIPGAQWFVSYEPLTGEEIWRVDHGDGFSNVPRPVYSHGTVYLCTGYNVPELWAIRVDGHGDVTGTHVKWKAKRQIPKNPSPLLVDDLIFLVSDNGIASCFDAETGKARWQKRIGGNYSASPILAGDYVYFLSHEGTVTAIRASADEPEPVTSQFEGQLLASPAVLSSSAILRTGSKLYCIE